jgi:hypothetical protein
MRISSSMAMDLDLDLGGKPLRENPVEVVASKLRIYRLRFKMLDVPSVDGACNLRAREPQLS